MDTITGDETRNVHFGACVEFGARKLMIGDTGRDNGVVNIYRHDGSSYVHSRVLRPFDANVLRFGHAIDIKDNQIVIGAPGVQGRADGAALVFEKSGRQWRKTGTLRPSVDTVDFGVSVAIDGRTAVVGGKDTQAFVFTNFVLPYDLPDFID